MYNTMLGKYELIPGSGIWIPDAGELAAGAQAGAAAAAAESLARSRGVQTAAQEAGVQALFQKMAANPLLTLGAFAGVAALTAYLATRYTSKGEQ